MGKIIKEKIQTIGDRLYSYRGYYIKCTDNNDEDDSITYSVTAGGAAGTVDFDSFKAAIEAINYSEDEANA